MLIALLLALGVDLVVVVVFAMLVFGRRRWLKLQAGEFAERIRVPGGVREGAALRGGRGTRVASGSRCGRRYRRGAVAPWRTAAISSTWSSSAVATFMTRS